jgi:SH3 domain-containing protein
MRRTLIFAAVLSLEVTACDGTVTFSNSGGDVGDDTPGADENNAGVLSIPSFTIGQLVQVCGSDVNQRSGPGTSYAVLRVIPVGTTLTVQAQSGSWYKVDWSGRVGWSYGAYLCAQTGGSGGSGGAGGSGGTGQGGSGGTGQTGGGRLHLLVGPRRARRQQSGRVLWQLSELFARRHAGCRLFGLRGQGLDAA